jgi:hypothetical protein
MFKKLIAKARATFTTEWKFYPPFVREIGHDKPQNLAGRARNFKVRAENTKHK